MLDLLSVLFTCTGIVQREADAQKQAAVPKEFNSQNLIPHISLAWKMSIGNAFLNSVITIVRNQDYAVTMVLPQSSKGKKYWTLLFGKPSLRQIPAFWLVLSVHSTTVQPVYFCFGAKSAKKKTVNIVILFSETTRRS